MYKARLPYIFQGNPLATRTALFSADWSHTKNAKHPQPT